MSDDKDGYTTGQRLAFDDLRGHFERGDKAAVLLAVEIACRAGCKIPEWAKPHVLNALQGWRFARFRTLDEAFDVERPKGFHVDKVHKWRRYGAEVWAEVDTERELGKSLDDAVAAVAARYGLNESETKRMYRAVEKYRSGSR